MRNIEVFTIKIDHSIRADLQTKIKANLDLSRYFQNKALEYASQLEEFTNIKRENSHAEKE